MARTTSSRPWALAILYVLLTHLVVINAIPAGAAPAPGTGAARPGTGTGSGRAGTGTGTGSGRGGTGSTGTGRTGTNARNGQKPPKVEDLRSFKFPVTGKEETLIEDDASVFSLGSFKVDEGQQQRLFENFNDQSLPFFAKLYDFFAAEEGYIDSTHDAYAEAKGQHNPFPDKSKQPISKGSVLTLKATKTAAPERIITTTFDPHKPTDACRAWTSLAIYCGDAGEECACYSGTYYVPDQWNSLAADCASMSSSRCATDDGWCQLGSTAADYAEYCATDVRDGMGASTTIFKFAETANGEPVKSTTTAEAKPVVKTPEAAPATTPVETETKKPSTTSTPQSLKSTSTAPAQTSTVLSNTNTSAASLCVRATQYFWLFPLLLQIML